MGQIADKLKELFLPYEKDSTFTRDGIVEKNSYYLNKKGNKVEINIDVESAWCESEKRIAIILKDQPGSSFDVTKWLKDETDKNENAADNRQLRGTRNCNGRRTQFIPNIGRIIWGLHNSDKLRFYEYEDSKQMMDEVIKCFNTVPFVLLESKKAMGKTSISNKELGISLQNDKLFLRELDVLQPNMIVCTSELIYHEVIKHYKEKQIEIPEHNSIRILPNSGKLVFCSYHPSWWCTRKVYYSVMNHYRAFLKSKEYQRFKFGKYILE